MIGYFGTDAFGSVRQITNSNGGTQDAGNFDPYGSLLEQNFGTANTSLGYTGAPSDPSGLVYLNARFYNPSIGSFQTHDPFGGSLGLPASQNGYNYAQSDPINGSDPSGKCDAQFNHSPLCSFQNLAIGAGAIHDLYLAGAKAFIQDPIATGIGAANGVLSATLYPLIDASTPIFGESARQFITDGFWSLAKRVGIRDVRESAGYAVGNFVGVAGATLYGGAELLEAGVGGLSKAATWVSNGGVGRAADALSNGISELGRVLGSESEAGIAEGANGGATCSFSADTTVATENGQVAIGTLKVGDYILSYNQKTGKVESKTVDAALVHTDAVIENLTIDGETLQTTPEHPFFTKDKGWVAAGKLSIGEEIFKSDGSYTKVQSITLIDRSQTMYNLTVHDDHTYFVGRGQLLVHNECSTWLNDLITKRTITAPKGVTPQDAISMMEQLITDKGISYDPYKNAISILNIKDEWYLGLNDSLDRQVATNFEGSVDPVKTRVQGQSAGLIGRNGHAETNSIIEYQLNGGGRNANGFMSVSREPCPNCVFNPSQSPYPGQINQMMWSTGINQIDVQFAGEASHIEFNPFTIISINPKR